MTILLKAPYVNLNTDSLIKEIIGEYNLESQGIIHAIAKNEKELLKGCQTMADYERNVKSFISEYNEK